MAAGPTASQRRGAPFPPPGVPADRGLPGDAEPASDRGGRHSLGEQLGGLFPDGLQFGSLPRPLTLLTWGTVASAISPPRRLGLRCDCQPVWRARRPAGAPRMGLRPSALELLLVQLLVAVAVLALGGPPGCGPGLWERCRGSPAAPPDTAPGRRPGASAPAAVARGPALAPARRRGGRGVAVVQGGRRDRAAPAGRPRTCVDAAQTDRLPSAARR
jgi:hypothetical protein